MRAISARILALPHARVREIGCGTGLLVETVAPHCDLYEATDFSAVAVARLQAWLATRPELAHVQVRRQAAHEVGGEAVDLVVINSVAQHFPDAAYLDRVLCRSWDGLAPGGHIVLGDIRLLGAQAIFVSAVQLARAPDDMSMGALREAIHAAWLAQSELLIDPQFFHRFAANHGGSVTVRLKSGGSDCEMTRYRCDVVLGKPARSPHSRPPPPAMLASMAALHDWLAAATPGRAMLRGLANARLEHDRTAHGWIARAAPARPVGALRTELAAMHRSPPRGIDPADIEALAARHGRECAALATPQTPDCGFDICIGDHAASFDQLAGPDAHSELSAGAVLTSRPLLMHALSRLSTSLHNDLSKRLEAAQMPGRILPVLPAEQLSPQPSGV